MNEVQLLPTLQTSPNSNEAPTDTPGVSFGCPTSPNLYLYLSMLICFSHAAGKVSKFNFWGPKKKMGLVDSAVLLGEHPLQDAALGPLRESP